MGRKFLSTPSARRATGHHGGRRQIHPISIHALREEGDRGHSSGCSLFCYFYPRPPRGGRPAAYSGPPSSMTFLSTPSARRATAGTAHCPDRRTISIHALREEGDEKIMTGSYILRDFYPRPPRGGRQHGSGQPGRSHRISIHALREEGDLTLEASIVTLSNFYPRPPRGGRRLDRQRMIAAIKFLSTPSARRATP